MLLFRFNIAPLSGLTLKFPGEVVNWEFPHSTAANSTQLANPCKEPNLQHNLKISPQTLRKLNPFSLRPFPLAKLLNSIRTSPIFTICSHTAFGSNRGCSVSGWLHSTVTSSNMPLPISKQTTHAYIPHQHVLYYTPTSSPHSQPQDQSWDQRVTHLLPHRPSVQFSRTLRSSLSIHQPSRCLLRNASNSCKGLDSKTCCFSLTPSVVKVDHRKIGQCKLHNY